MASGGGSNSNKKKVIVYIDGQNFYHSVRDTFGQKFDAKYTNFWKLAEFLSGSQDLELVGVKYYTAHYPFEVDPEKNRQDQAAFDRWKAQGVKIELGIFKTHPSQPPVEKGVDVRLAIDLVVDGFSGYYNRAYVLSKDSDIVPAISKIRQLKSNAEVYCVTLDNKPPSDYRSQCNGHVPIYKSTYKKCYEGQTAPATEAGISALKSKFSKQNHRKST